MIRAKQPNLLARGDREPAFGTPRKAVPEHGGGIGAVDDLRRTRFHIPESQLSVVVSGREESVIRAPGKASGENAPFRQARNLLQDLAVGISNLDEKIVNWMRARCRHGNSAALMVPRNRGPSVSVGMWRIRHDLPVQRQHSVRPGVVRDDGDLLTVRIPGDIGDPASKRGPWKQPHEFQRLRVVDSHMAIGHGGGDPFPVRTPADDADPRTRPAGIDVPAFNPGKKARPFDEAWQDRAVLQRIRALVIPHVGADLEPRRLRAHLPRTQRLRRREVELRGDRQPGFCSRSRETSVGRRDGRIRTLTHSSTGLRIRTLTSSATGLATGLA